ncbi:hypothetical protein [Leptospira meyeri]|uniref:hypothetical protein n=1 Tax=Leptospira meyeri TaxID=29508 RepID=UPI001FAF27A2|nr:hypothetical protein [Leptospira meyeri]
MAREFSLCQIRIRPYQGMMFQNEFIVRMGKLASFLALDILISLFANLSFFSLHRNQNLTPTLLLFYLSSVWALYLADHLWDFRREKELLSERGNFYNKFQRTIVIIIILLVLISIFVGIDYEFTFLWEHLPLLLSFLFCIGLVVRAKSPVPKEILVSGFYTLGVLAPFGGFGNMDGLTFVFFLHVFANVLLTYNQDRKFDQRQNTFTLNQNLSPKRLRMVVLCLLGVGFFFLIFLWTKGQVKDPFFFGMGLAYLWLGVCNFLGTENFPFKSLCELSYLPLLLPQIFFFFSLLP